MALNSSGFTLISGLAYFENPRMSPGLSADSYFFDVTMHTCALENENPYVKCSLCINSTTDCTPMACNIYMINAKVAAFCPNMHPPSPTYGKQLFAFIGDFKTITSSHSFPPRILQLHHTQATMTVAGTVSAIDADNEYFEMCISMRIQTVPGLATLMARINIAVYKDCKSADECLPRLSTVICVKGQLIGVTPSFACMEAEDFIYLSDVDGELDGDIW
ncbi:hypothetical protein V8E53_014402 [Lactarius tabidus]